MHNTTILKKSCLFSKEIYKENNRKSIALDLNNSFDGLKLI